MTHKYAPVYSNHVALTRTYRTPYSKVIRSLPSRRPNSCCRGNRYKSPGYGYPLPPSLYLCMTRQVTFISLISNNYMFIVMAGGTHKIKSMYLSINIQQLQLLCIYTVGDPSCPKPDILALYLLKHSLLSGRSGSPMWEVCAIA